MISSVVGYIASVSGAIYTTFILLLHMIIVHTLIFYHKIVTDVRVGDHLQRKSFCENVTMWCLGISRCKRLALWGLMTVYVRRWRRIFVVSTASPPTASQHHGTLSTATWNEWVVVVVVVVVVLVVVVVVVVTTDCFSTPRHIVYCYMERVSSCSGSSSSSISSSSSAVLRKT